jgi:hypothetical protein
MTYIQSAFWISLEVLWTAFWQHILPRKNVVNIVPRRYFGKLAKWWRKLTQRLNWCLQNYWYRYVWEVEILYLSLYEYPMY